MEGIINIAGAMPRIGTTTCALHLAAFLHRYNYQAAYVEMNPQDYLWSVERLYSECKLDHDKNCLTLGSFDLYSKPKLTQLTAGGTHYDYIICDYGNIQSKAFDRKAFENCGAKILVAGNKANEIFATEEALADDLFRDAVYLFNFVRKQDRQDVLDMMQGRKDRTEFMPYEPDPFEEENYAQKMRKPSGEIFTRIVYQADECLQRVMGNVVDIMEGKGGGR